ncbi:MAG: dual specificity protein phosphatase family protein [Deltaproteobacteria bacterium]
MTDTADTIARQGRRSSVRWAAFLAAADVLAWLCALAYAIEGAPVAVVAVFAYAALSLLAVCVLYVRSFDGANPGPVLKGTRHAWLQPLFVPYRVVAWTITALARVLHVRDPVISEIGPGVFMGVRLFPHEHAMLSERGVRSVLDLTSELPTNRVLSRAPFERYGLPTLDRTPPTIDEIARAADWAAARVAAGDGVYIHCAFGRGRSATLAAAVCLRLGWAHDATGAVALVARKRPVIRVGGAQLAALHSYASRLASTPAP